MKASPPKETRKIGKRVENGRESFIKASEKEKKNSKFQLAKKN